MLGFSQHNHADRSDWFWYTVLPVVGYALLLAAAATALRGMAVSLDLLAAALAFLLAAGIRNAWHMIVFLVTMPRTPASRLRRQPAGLTRCSPTSGSSPILSTAT